MNRSQTISELVSDARGQFAETREAVSEPKLVFEISNLTQIGEQADGAMRFKRQTPERLAEEVSAAATATRGQRKRA